MYVCMYVCIYIYIHIYMHEYVCIFGDRYLRPHLIRPSMLQKIEDVPCDWLSEDRAAAQGWTNLQLHAAGLASPVSGLSATYQV